MEVLQDIAVDKHLLDPVFEKEEREAELYRQTHQVEDGTFTETEDEEEFNINDILAKQAQGEDEDDEEEEEKREEENGTEAEESETNEGGGLEKKDEEESVESSD